MFGQGEDWRQGLTEVRQNKANVARWKQAVKSVPSEVVTHPIPGEVMIADIDSAAPAGHTDRVLAWARSVAEHRCGSATRGAGTVGSRR